MPSLVVSCGSSLKCPSSSGNNSINVSTETPCNCKATTALKNVEEFKINKNCLENKN